MLTSSVKEIENVVSLQLYKELTLRKKCPYSELFWSAFSCIRTEYGEIRSISPYSVRMRENVDQNNSEYGHFSRSVSHVDPLPSWDSNM